MKRKAGRQFNGERLPAGAGPGEEDIVQDKGEFVSEGTAGFELELDSAVERIGLGEPIRRLLGNLPLPTIGRAVSISGEVSHFEERRLEGPTEDAVTLLRMDLLVLTAGRYRASIRTAAERMHIGIEAGLQSRPHPRGEENLLQSIRSIAVAWLGFVPFHAAAIVFEECAVLLPGTSGSGKSTLSAAAALAGASVMTDDLIAVSVSNPLSLLSLRPDMALRSRSQSLGMGLRGFEAFQENVGRNPRVWLRPRNPELVREVKAIAEVLFPRVVNAERSATLPMTQLQALRRLTRGAGGLWFDPRLAPLGTERLKALAALSAAPRVARLDLGRDLLSDPVQTIQRLIVSASSGSRTAPP